jgi:3-polyprenyl-4-hydroxybenzoate decarboxylase
MLRHFRFFALTGRNAAGSGDQGSPKRTLRYTGFGSKMGVDATRKWPSEGFTRPWPDEIKMDPEVKKRIDALWKQLGL